MRVAVIVRGGLHPSGRVQVVPALLSLLARLADRHDVHAFAVEHLPAAASYSLRGCTVHDLGRPGAPLGLGLLAKQRALVAALRRHGPFDLLHGFWGDPAGVLAVRAGRRLGVPSIVTCDSGEFVSLPDIDYGTQRSWRGRRRIRDVCRFASAVHVCTQFMANLAPAHGPTPAVIPIGAEAPNVGRPAEGPPWRLLQVGSLSRVKNQALLIEALAVLARTHDAHADLVGGDTLAGALQDLARARGVEHRMTFHGFLPSDALPPLRARAHLYVQTSRHEAAGVSVLEAAAAGIPVVGTRAGYLADWPSDRAVALDHLSPDTLAQAIAGLLDSPERRAHLAVAAAAWSTAHDSAWSAEQFDRLYRAVAARAATPASRNRGPR